MISTTELSLPVTRNAQPHQFKWMHIYQSSDVTEKLVHRIIDNWDNFCDLLKIRTSNELSREWFVLFRKFLGERKGAYKTIAHVELHEEIMAFIMNTRCPLQKEGVLKWNLFSIGQWIHQRPHLMPLLGLKSPNSIPIKKMWRAMTSIHQVAKNTTYGGVFPQAIDKCILTWCTTGGTLQ